MLESNRLVAFLATTNPARALAFYRDVLGLPLESDDQFALVFVAGGTALRIQKVPEHAPQPFTALGWRVDELVATVASLVDRGVTFERYAGMTQDANGIWTAPGGARVAWLKDPDGNVLSFTEEAGMRATAQRDNIVPELFVDDGARALTFYCAAFGATEISRMKAPDGRLLHGELTIAGHRLFVVDEFPDLGTCRCPKTLGGTGVRITLEVTDADSFVARASAAGATIMMPVTDMFWGARYAKLMDPFGHEWGINQQNKQLTPAEEQESAQRFFADSSR